MAEQEGFEPSIRGYRIHTFQACAFDHSATAPHPGTRASSGQWRGAQLLDCLNCDPANFDEPWEPHLGDGRFPFTPRVAVLRGMAFPANTAPEPFPVQQNVREGAFLLRRRWQAAA